MGFTRDRALAYERVSVARRRHRIFHDHWALGIGYWGLAIVLH
jgi:hypothetical protein